MPTAGTAAAPTKTPIRATVAILESKMMLLISRTPTGSHASAKSRLSAEQGCLPENTSTPRAPWTSRLTVGSEAVPGLEDSRSVAVNRIAEASHRSVTVGLAKTRDA